MSDPRSSRAQAGNVFFALFGAVGLVGVLGAATMTTIKGPVTSMHNVTQRTIAENNMIAAGKLALMAATNQADDGDCDADTAIEPVPFSTTGTGPHPDGGGYLPGAIGAAQEDPWGNMYGYCAWDHGAVIKTGVCADDAGRLSGSAAHDGAALAVISSGPDRLFQTSCGDAPNYVERTEGSDDVVLEYTYDEAGVMSGGLWNVKGSDPDTAEIAKNLEVKDSGGDVVFGVDSSTDPTKPAIKVDYIQQLSAGAVSFLSNIALGGRWLSGDGDDEGISITSDGSAVISSGHLITGNPNGGLAFNSGPAGLDSETGFWFRANDTLGEHLPPYTNLMRITADGNVGIGTSAPTSLLNISAPEGEWRFEPWALAPALVFERHYADGEAAKEGDMLASLLTSSALGDGSHDPSHFIIVYADENHSTGAAGTRVAIRSIPNSSLSSSVDSLTVDSTGNIGIGTENPSSKLHVSGGNLLVTDNGAWSQLAARAYSEEAAHAGVLNLQRARGTRESPAYAEQGDVLGQIVMRNHVSDVGSSIVAMAAEDHSETKSGTNLIFRTTAVGGVAEAARMRITPEGNVGIGIASPTHLLTVAGPIRGDYSGSYDLWLQGGAATSGDARNLAILGHKGNDRLYLNYSSEYAGGTQIGGPVYITGGTLNMGSNRIASVAAPASGNDAANKAYVDSRVAAGTGFAETDPEVGAITNGRWCRGVSGIVVCDQTIPTGDNLGNHTATANLNMSNRAIVSSAGTIRDANGGWARTYNDTGWYNATHGGGWYMTDSNYLRNYNAKGVYVGTTSLPAVRGDSSSSYGIFGQSANNYGVYGRTTATNRGGVIGYSGDASVFGILGHSNTYSLYGNGRLYVSGNMQTAGNVTASAYYQSSDRNLKTDIETIADPFALLNAIEGKHFLWKDSGKGAYGVIAQDVEAVMPDAIGENDEGYKTVEYSQIIAPLIEAVKQLKTANDNLDTRVRALEADNDNLRAENAALKSGAR